MSYFNVANDALNKVGSFNLTNVNIIPYHSLQGDNQLSRLDITDLVVDFQIYENIESHFLTGEMTIIDGTNMLATVPLTGFERLEFKLNTPGLQKGYDFSVLSGHPMLIYSVKSRLQAAERTTVYTIQFVSLERLKNDQSRVVRTLTGPVEDFILSMVREELDSKKDLIVEESSSITKFIPPRVTVIHCIDKLSKLTQSKNFDNAGFIFYETSLGFQFKSFESMFCNENGFARPIKARYSPKTTQIRDNKGNKDIISDYQVVKNFKVVSTFNTMRNLNQGVFASRMITHDQFTKTFKEIDFDYHTNYINQNHLEPDARGNKRDGNGVIPFFNFKAGKTISDFKEGKLYFVSGTTKQFEDYEKLKGSEILPKRNSQKAALTGLRIEIEVPGFTGINAGDVVHFTMPAFVANKDTNDKDTDPYLTGRYLIAAIRHNVDVKGTKKHKMNMTLVKDSFNTSLPEENIDLYTGQEKEGDSYLQYSIDKNL